MILFIIAPDRSGGQVSKHANSTPKKVLQTLRVPRSSGGCTHILTSYFVANTSNISILGNLDHILSFRLWCQNAGKQYFFSNQRNEHPSRAWGPEILHLGFEFPRHGPTPSNPIGDASTCHAFPALELCQLLSGRLDPEVATVEAFVGVSPQWQNAECPIYFFLHASKIIDPQKCDSPVECSLQMRRLQLSSHALQRGTKLVKARFHDRGVKRNIFSTQLVEVIHGDHRWSMYINASIQYQSTEHVLFQGVYSVQFATSLAENSAFLPFSHASWKCPFAPGTRCCLSS